MSDELTFQEYGLIADIIDSPFTLAEIRSAATKAGLKKEHFTNDAMRCAFATFADRADVNDRAAMAGAIQDGLRKTFGSVSELETAVSHGSLSAQDLQSRARNIAKAGRRRIYDAEASSIAKDFTARKIGTDEFLSRTAALDEKRRHDETADDGNVISFADLQLPSPEERMADTLIGDGWLRKGQSAMITSTPGTGKSVMAMQLALAWAAGRETLGLKPTRPLRIAICQTEDDEYEMADFLSSMEKGARAVWNWSDGDILDAKRRCLLINHDGTTGEAFIDCLRTTLLNAKAKGTPIDLVIVNPLTAFFEGDMAAPAEMTAFLRKGFDSVIKAAGTKCGLLIFHHTTKQPTNPRQQTDPKKNVQAQYLAAGAGDLANWIRAQIILWGQKNGSFEFSAVKRGKRLGWPTGKDEANPTRTLFHAPPETKICFWVENEEETEALHRFATASTAPNAAADPAAPSPEDDVPTLAEALKNKNLTFTDARELARETLGRKKGDAAFNLLSNRLKNSTSGCHGLIMKDDPENPRRKFIATITQTSTP